MVHVWELGSGTQTQANRKANAAKAPSSDRHYIRNTNISRTSFLTGWKMARSLFVVAAFFLLFVGFSFMRSFADEPVSAVPAANETIVIADAGDTLWSIASEVKRDGMDTRQAVHRIMERNGLSESQLDIGARLIIPAGVGAVEGS
jgi:LysM domain.